MRKQAVWMFGAMVFMSILGSDRARADNPPCEYKDGKLTCPDPPKNGGGSHTLQRTDEKS
jgi:hypothetical protein